MTGPVEVLEGGPASGRGSSRVLVAASLLAVLVVGGLWVRDRVAERALRQTVEITATMGVETSSTSPPGGAVGYFLVVHNDGPRPLSVLSVHAATPGLQVRMGDGGGRRIGVREEIAIPLSARVTCADGAGTAGRLPAVIVVRTTDGGTVSRRIELTPAALVLDVAATLCATRPELRDHELSGPVLRTG